MNYWLLILILPSLFGSLLLLLLPPILLFIQFSFLLSLLQSLLLLPPLSVRLLQLLLLLSLVRPLLLCPLLLDLLLPVEVLDAKCQIWIMIILYHIVSTDVLLNLSYHLSINLSSVQNSFIDGLSCLGFWCYHMQYLYFPIFSLITFFLSFWH